MLHRSNDPGIPRRRRRDRRGDPEGARRGGDAESRAAGHRHRRLATMPRHDPPAPPRTTGEPPPWRRRRPVRASTDGGPPVPWHRPQATPHPRDRGRECRRRHAKHRRSAARPARSLPGGTRSRRTGGTAFASTHGYHCRSTSASASPRARASRSKVAPSIEVRKGCHPSRSPRRARKFGLGVVPAHRSTSSRQMSIVRRSRAASRLIPHRRSTASKVASRASHCCRKRAKTEVRSASRSACQSVNVELTKSRNRVVSPGTTAHRTTGRCNGVPGPGSPTGSKECEASIDLGTLLTTASNQLPWLFAQLHATRDPLSDEGEDDGTTVSSAPARRSGLRSKLPSDILSNELRPTGANSADRTVRPSGQRRAQRTGTDSAERLSSPS